jgi:MoxR-like ATPase
MFEPATIRALAQRHRPFFDTLASVELNLKDRFVESEDAVDALVLAVATGESLLLIGPPGTGKSRLIRSFCHLLGLLDLDDPTRPNSEYFEALLSPFSEPTEIFGNWDPARAMREGVLVRQEGLWMQMARVALLEEVFSASSAILMSLHVVLNERMLHDRGQRLQMRLQCFFGSTNEVPETAELRAIFDRFVLRCRVDDVQLDRPNENGLEPHERLEDLIVKGWHETYETHAPVDEAHRELLDQASALQHELRYVAPVRNSALYPKLARIIRFARQRELSEMSNRRIVKMSRAMLVHCLYEYVKAGADPAVDPEVGIPQLRLIGRFFLDQADEQTIRDFDRIAVGSTP